MSPLMTMPLGNVTESADASAAWPVEMAATEAPRVAKVDAFRKSRREGFALFIFILRLALMLGPILA
jgi:hypothetical protein